jgi:hypothetical protein
MTSVIHMCMPVTQFKSHSHASISVRSLFAQHTSLLASWSSRLEFEAEYVWAVTLLRAFDFDRPRKQFSRLFAL